MKDFFIIVLAILGVPLLVLAQVTGIGVFLYDWGVQDMALGLAAWGAFKVWITMVVVGGISFITAMFLNA